MKKYFLKASMRNILFVFYSLIFGNAFAQQPYVLTNFKSRNYIPTTGNSITSNLDDVTFDMTFYTTTTGYSYLPFIFMGRENHAIKVNSNGVIKFVSGYRLNYTEADLSDFVILGADLVQHKTLPSKIVYKKEVTTNDITLTIDWQNMSFKKDTSRLSFINFKVTISTSTGFITLMFGANSGVDSSYFINKKPVIQLFRCDSVNNLTVQGNPASPIITTYQKDIIKTLTSMPDTGSIYNFASPFAFSDVSTYPHHFSYSSLEDLPINFERYGGDLVDVDYTTNNGLTWNSISKGSNYGSVHFLWNIPNNLNAQNLILRLNDGTYQAYKMDTIKIINPTLSSLTFINPIGGKILGGGDTTAIISWNSVNLGYKIDLYISTDGINWSSLKYQYENKEGVNTCKFSVPGYESTTCLIKGDAYYKIATSSLFTITQAKSAIKLTSFNTGGIVFANDIKDISFQELNVPKINLFYSVNNGVNWKQIDTNISTATPYPWHIPNEASTKCIVKIVDASDTTIFSISSVVFTIAKSSIKLTSFNIGEMVFVGEVNLISFQVKNVLNLNIYYSTNNGGIWKPIASNVSITTPYSWKIPNDISTQCVIKIEDATDSTTYVISSTTFPIAKKLNSIDEAIINYGKKQIWPNPITNGKILVTQLVDLPHDYIIVDLLGRKLKNGYIIGKVSEINVEDLNKGIYLIIFDTEKSSQYQKLIIE